jgi:hypothetical protein
MNTSLLTLSLVAAAALTANRFVTAAGGVPSANGNAVGVTRAGAVSGELVPVDVIGTSMVEASAAIAAGVAVASTNDGRAVTFSTGVTVARALTPATAAGQLIEVLLIAN